ncbi:MAG TPA: hypothetical protein ENI15_12510 [Spirochaetes bacterium]|nr:hypothetical protein [Spirochaetota bacterium]
MVKCLYTIQKLIEADYESYTIEKGVSIEVFSRALLENLPASMGAPFFIDERRLPVNRLIYIDLFSGI